MRTIVYCPCGVRYERTEKTLTFHDKNEFRCHACGEPLERWNGSQLPVFRQIEKRHAGGDRPGAPMGTLDVFFRGMMVAWTPSLILLAWVLRWQAPSEGSREGEAIANQRD